MIQLPWGSGTLAVELPPGWNVLGQYVPQPMSPAESPLDRCRAALARPLAAAPLAERDLSGKRILLVSDDVSRPTRVATFFPAVRDALLAAGASAERIEILFALGVHRPMTEAEAIAKVGPDAIARHRWHNHNAFDPEQLAHLGRTARGTPVWLNRLLTQFDLIIPLGAVEPHVLLGFSGGYKMLLPGCAGAETIGTNHMQGLDQGAFNYVGVSPDDSPMRLDLEEACQMLGREVFVVNAALTPEARVVDFFCGCPLAAVRTAAQYVRRHAEVEVPAEADVVIANSAPFDADLRQSLKCMGNTFFAARPGGVLLGFARCQEGRGDVPLPPVTLPYGLLRRLMHLLGERRIMRFVRVVKRFDPIEQKFLTHFGLQMLRRNHVYVYSESLPAETGRKLGMLRQYGDVRRMIDDAVRQVGPRATVAIFPQGGCTYSRGPIASDPRAMAAGAADAAGAAGVA